MISAITLIIFSCTSAAGHNVAVHLRIPPLGGAKPTVCLSIRLSSLTKTPPLSSSSLQAQRQQCLCCGLGQDGGAVVERERSRGEEESPEDDTEAVTQPHDWKYTHVDCWRRHTPARWNGPIGHAGGHRFPPTPTTLYLLSLPQPINSFSQLTPLSCLFIHTFSSPPAVYQPGVTVHLSSFPPSFRPPVYLSQTFHLLTSSQLLWLRSILYSQNSTVYVMQKVSTMTKKKTWNIRQPLHIGYGPTQTMSDKLSYYLYFMRLVLVWSMNGSDGGAQLVSTSHHSSFTVGGFFFCKQLPNERFAKPIRKFHFCMECVRMNKDYLFFCLNIKPPLFTSVKSSMRGCTDTRTHWMWGMRLVEKFKKAKWNVRSSFSQNKSHC